jgi:hypothetical protein
VLFEGDIDDCAVVAAWAGEACMQDCSAEDASVWEALSTFVCSFDGLGSFEELFSNHLLFEPDFVPGCGVPERHL